MESFYKIYKNLGETPLEALERFRAEKIVSSLVEFKDLPMTYAGRLDPMAEGELLILVGDECKKKDDYLGLDKEYEVEIIFGIETDTYDALGLVQKINPITKKDIENIDLKKYVGKFSQEYPLYSSKTVNGKQLHEYARENNEPEYVPTKDVEIYSIDLLEAKDIESKDLLKEAGVRIGKVKGDFRQEEILEKWLSVLVKESMVFPLIKIRAKCSSGTYMRSLAHKIGQDLNSTAFAFSIKRTKIWL